MDNLAHTLAGLAIAEAGLRRKTALGATTLAIAANLPDIDAFIYLVGDPSTHWRFGAGGRTASSRCWCCRCCSRRACEA